MKDEDAEMCPLRNFEKCQIECAWRVYDFDEEGNETSGCAVALLSHAMLSISYFQINPEQAKQQEIARRLNG